MAGGKAAKLATLADVAAAIGVSRETVRTWRRAGWRDKPPFSLPRLLQWLRSSGPWKSRPESRADDPLLLAAGTSPALERYREERAALAKYERLRREGELIPRERIREGLNRIAAILRGVGESLQRQYGPDAHKLLEEGLDEAGREIESLFNDDDDGGGEDDDMDGNEDGDDCDGRAEPAAE